MKVRDSPIKLILKICFWMNTDEGKWSLKHYYSLLHLTKHVSFPEFSMLVIDKTIFQSLFFSQSSHHLSNDSFILHIYKVMRN